MRRCGRGSLNKIGRSGRMLAGWTLPVSGDDPRPPSDPLPYWQRLDAITDAVMLALIRIHMAFGDDPQTRQVHLRAIQKLLARAQGHIDQLVVDDPGDTAAPISPFAPIAPIQRHKR